MMTDSLYKGTGGHNYIQDEDMETSFIKQQQEEVRNEIDLSLQDGTLSSEKIDQLTAQIIKNTCEEIKRQYFSHTNTDKKLIEVVEDIINTITHPTQ